MSSSLHLLLLLLLLLSPLFIANGNADLIDSTCRQSNYYDLCISTINKDPNAPKGELSDLVKIFVLAGKDLALDTSGYVSRQFQKVDDPALSQVIVECVDLYHNTFYELQDTRGDLNDGGYTLAQQKVAVAAKHPGECHDKFTKGRFAYPNELAGMEKTLQETCDVALTIIAIIIRDYS